jgi:hypothetical protein
VSVVHGPKRIDLVVRCRIQDREAVERFGRVVLSRDVA